MWAELVEAPTSPSIGSESSLAMPVTFSGAFFSVQGRGRSWTRLLSFVAVRMRQGQTGGDTCFCSAFHTRCHALRPVGDAFGLGLQDAEAQVDQGVEQLRQSQRDGQLWERAEGQGRFTVGDRQDPNQGPRAR